MARKDPLTSAMPLQERLGQSAQNVVAWCSLEHDMEIDLLSDRRIEGIGARSKKLDCKKCQEEGLEPLPFTWIPK